MKSIFTFLYFLLLAIQSFGQINLVPNPSFEDTVFCPNGYSEIYACKDWINFGNTPDYFNSCAPIGGPNVPNSGFGFQNAHTGNGMIGFIPYRQPNSPNGPNYRECVGAKLISPLQIGLTYFISFNVNYSNYHPFQSVASNKIGLKLFTVSFDSINRPPLDNTALLYSHDVITDSIGWIHFTGAFIADSAYQYIAIGSFFDDAHTDTINLSNFPDASYYYVDDVCLSTDSLYNENWTSINNLENDLPIVTVYPNPSTGNFIVKGQQMLKKIDVCNMVGQVIWTSNQWSDCYYLDLKNLSLGTYYLDIYTDSAIVKRVIYLYY